MSSEPQASSPEQFEASLRELEELVESLEQGELSLEDSLQRFERGITLARHCQEALTRAEQRVQALVDKSDEPRLEDLEQE